MCVYINICVWCKSLVSKKGKTTKNTLKSIFENMLEVKNVVKMVAWKRKRKTIKRKFVEEICHLSLSLSLHAYIISFDSSDFLFLRSIRWTRRSIMRYCEKTMICKVKQGGGQAFQPRPNMQSMFFTRFSQQIFVRLWRVNSCGVVHAIHQRTCQD